MELYGWLLALVIAYFVYKKLTGKKAEKHAATRRPASQSPARPDKAGDTLGLRDLEPPQTEEEAVLRGYDWDEARMALQKIAYGMAGESVSQEDKDRFKAFMARFAKHDPLYKDTMVLVRRLLRERPGVVQSEIYKGRDDRTKEMVRYVLYFAEVLGDIRREKKGRSYQLFLPSDYDGEVISGQIE